VIDLEGRFVLPGLWDRHVHFDQMAQVSARLDLSHVGSAAAAGQLVAAHVAAGDTPPDATMVGYGFATRCGPTRRDAKSSMRGSRNSRRADQRRPAQCLAQLRSVASFRPPGRCRRLLREEAAMQVIGEVARVGDDVADAWCLAAARSAAARGVVGIVDMERPFSLDAWRRRIASGNRSLRVVSAVWSERLDEAIARNMHTGDGVDGTTGCSASAPSR